MSSYIFSQRGPEGEGQSPFDQLLPLFIEILQHTSGNADEAMAWLTEIDKEHGLTTDDYGIGDFLQDLKDKGYIRENEDGNSISITPKTEQGIRKRSLDQIFGKIKKGKSGNHRTVFTGTGDEANSDVRPYQFGDPLDSINYSNSIHNAFVNRGIEEFSLHEEDLEIQERDYKSQTSTVLMIDLSHSMILYGEDRITPAKKVAMALSELITTRYPKDTLDIVAFGNDAWPVTIKDLPYLEVGPYHTNTVAGLELAANLLRRRKSPNKQIFMITDGKPTCLKIGNKYYKNPFGLDQKIMNRTLNLAGQLRRLRIPVITFMIARDPYLQSFVREFTEVNGGKAFYSSLDGLGEYIFEDYQRNKRRTVR